MITALILILCANGTPVILGKLFSDRWFSTPVDHGYCLPDGYPLFGQTKTWRGLLGSVLATTLLALLLGVAWQHGLFIALLAMCGDLVSSFVKRRLGMASSQMALGLDQFPESGLPLLYARFTLDISWAEVLYGMLGFLLAELVLSRIFYALGIRKRPY